VVFASLLKFANAGIATAFRDYLALSGTAGSVMFTEAPASVNDYTVFDPEEFPSSGLFLSFSANPPKLWVYFGGQPAWNNIELNA
jgi:hypothetical protein